MNNLEYKRNAIQNKKLELLRDMHEAIGRLKAVAFEHQEEKDVKKKQILKEEFEFLKKKITARQMKVDEYNNFLKDGHLTTKKTKGNTIDLEV